MVTAVAPSGLSHWADERRRQAYVSGYEAALTLWPIPFERRWVETDFGPTHVIVSGDQTGEPIVLLHAASLSATQWYLQAQDLGACFQLFAVDLMGDIGLSTERRPIRSRRDGAGWIASLLDGLSIDRAVFIGSSFGGFHAVNMAVARPDRVRALVLLAPAATILPFRTVANVMIRAGSMVPMPFTVKPGLRGMMHGALPDPCLVRQMELGVGGFRYDHRGLFPSGLPDEDLARIGCPTLLLIGDDELIYDPRDAVERARSHIPGAEAKIVPEAGHLLGMQRPDVVNERILAFLGAHPEACEAANDEAAQ